MLSLSLQQYDEFLKFHTVSTDKASMAVLQNAGSRIQKSAEGCFIGLASQRTAMSGITAPEKSSQYR